MFPLVLEPAHAEPLEATGSFIAIALQLQCYCYCSIAIAVSESRGHPAARLDVHCIRNYWAQKADRIHPEPHGSRATDFGAVPLCDAFYEQCPMWRGSANTVRCEKCTLTRCDVGCTSQTVSEVAFLAKQR